MTDINEIVGEWLEVFEQRVEKSVRDLIRAQYESATVADSYLKAMERINDENVAIRNAWLALQDVLALHKKHEGMPNLQTPQGDFYQCVACQEIYPCSTRIRITNRLGGME